MEEERWIPTFVGMTFREVGMTGELRELRGQVLQYYFSSSRSIFFNRSAHRSIMHANIFCYIF